ncbi:MAG: hypothetical protein ACNA8W_07005 [Bradymonadaceae bacterium]
MIGNLVKSAVNTATSLANDAVSRASSAASDAINTANKTANKAADKVNGFDVKDTFEKVKTTSSKIKDGFSNLLSGKSPGKLMSEGLDKLGLPDWVGPLVGAVVDFGSMNYASGLDNAVNLGSKIASSMGNEELAGFLDNASNITGMYAKTMNTITLTAATGGGGAAGALAQIGSMGGKVGQAAQLAGKAIEVAGYVEKGIGIVDNLKDGDIKGAGTEVFGLFGGNVDVLGGILGDGVGKEVLETIGGALGEGGNIFGAAAEKVLGQGLDLGLLKELPIGDLFAKLDIDVGEFQSMAGPALDLLEKFMEESGTVTDMLGTMLADAGFSEDLVKTLMEIVGEKVVGAAGGTDLNLAEFLAEVSKTCQGLLDMAGTDQDAAKLVMDLLGEAGSMSEKVTLADLQAAYLRP